MCFRIDYVIYNYGIQKKTEPVSNYRKCVLFCKYSLNVYIFKSILVVIVGYGICCEIAIRWIPLDLSENVNTGPGDSLVPSGSKPLPEPMLTQITVAICVIRLQGVKALHQLYA